MGSGQQKDLAKWVSAAVAIVLFLTSTGFALGIGFGRLTALENNDVKQDTAIVDLMRAVTDMGKVVAEIKVIVSERGRR